MSIRGRRLVTEGKNIKEVLLSEFSYQEDFILEQQEVWHIIELAGGLWQHNGDPKAPHAVLRSGKHSDGFISVPAALKYFGINHIFAGVLANKIMQHYTGPVDWVVGSDHAAATFSYAVLGQMMDEYGRMEDRDKWNIKHDFTEKAVVNGEETQKWSRHIIGRDECVLQIEELCTSNLTLQRVRNGIAQAHPDYPITYVPIIGMAVNRTGSDTFQGSRIVSLLDITFNEWQPGECPLCANGSEALENVKKSVATWAKLTGLITV